jgi:hypothetical protein
LNVLKIKGFWPQQHSFEIGDHDGKATSDKGQGVVLLLHFIYDLNEIMVVQNPPNFRFVVERESSCRHGRRRCRAISVALHC